MSLATLKARYASMDIAQLNHARDAITKRLYYYNHTAPDRIKARALSAEAKVILANIYRLQGTRDKYLSLLMLAGELLKPVESAIDSAKATAGGVFDSVSSAAKMLGLGVAVLGLIFVVIKAKQ